jgi:hypothetical protein
MSEVSEVNADSVVNCAFHRQYHGTFDYFDFEPRCITDDIKRAAGLEGDGLVVLRYAGDGVAGEGQRVTVAGVLKAPSPQIQGMDPLYRLTPPSPMEVERERNGGAQ